MVTVCEHPFLLGNAQMSLMGTAVGRDTGKADRDAYTRGKGVCEQRSKYA
jgi:hypothetical protein